MNNNININNQSDNIFYASSNNNNNQKKKWTVNSAIDRPPLSTNGLRRAVSLLNSIPPRRDFDSQLQKWEDYEEAQCDAQVREWQAESERLISSDENPDNFKFALKGLLACAEKLELDRLRKRIISMRKTKQSVRETEQHEQQEQERLTTLYHSLKKGWQVIIHCFQCAVEQGADLDKMLSVIGYMGIWHDELPTPAGGRRPGAIHEIHQQLYNIHQQQQQQQNNHNAQNNNTNQIAQVVKGIRALDRLQLEETGRELVPDVCNFNNAGGEPIVGVVSSRYETVEERREQQSIADYLKQRHPTIQPNDDNSSFVRQSLELRQAVVLAKLTQQQQRASSPVEKLFIADPTSTIQLFPHPQASTTDENNYNTDNNNNINQTNVKSQNKHSYSNSNSNVNQNQQQQSLSQMKNIQTSLIRVVPEAERNRSPTTPRNYRSGENNNNVNNDNDNDNNNQQRQQSSSSKKSIIDIVANDGVGTGGGSLSPSFEEEEHEVIVQHRQQHRSGTKQKSQQMMSVDSALSPLMQTPMAMTASHSKRQQQQQQHHRDTVQLIEEDDEDDFFDAVTDHVQGQTNFSNASNLSFSNPPPPTN